MRAWSFLWRNLGRRDPLKLAKCRLRIERKKFKTEAEKKKDESTSLVSNEFSHILIFGDPIQRRLQITEVREGGDVSYGSGRFILISIPLCQRHPIPH